jgi:hypothetical protein
VALKYYSPMGSNENAICLLLQPNEYLKEKLINFENEKFDE